MTPTERAQQLIDEQQFTTAQAIGAMRDLIRQVEKVEQTLAETSCYLDVLENRIEKLEYENPDPAPEC